MFPFHEEKSCWTSNESVRSDGVIVAWKADSSGDTYSFSGIKIAPESYGRR